MGTGMWGVMRDWWLALIAKQKVKIGITDHKCDTMVFLFLVASDCRSRGNAGSYVGQKWLSCFSTNSTFNSYPAVPVPPQEILGKIN